MSFTIEERAARALPCMCSTGHKYPDGYHEPACPTHRRKDVERELESSEVALRSNTYAWCVELADSPADRPSYLCVAERSLQWSPNWRQAIRFSRFVDALDVSRTLGLQHDGAVRICEHGFGVCNGEITPLSGEEHRMRNVPEVKL